MSAYAHLSFRRNDLSLTFTWNIHFWCAVNEPPFSGIFVISMRNFCSYSLFSAHITDKMHSMKFEGKKRHRLLWISNWILPNWNAFQFTYKNLTNWQNLIEKLQTVRCLCISVLARVFHIVHLPFPCTTNVLRWNRYLMELNHRFVRNVVNSITCHHSICHIRSTNIHLKIPSTSWIIDDMTILM